MRKYSVDVHRVHLLVRLVVTLLVLSLFVGYVAGSAYCSLLMKPNTTVTSPPVTLQAGTTGDTTIFANGTSAKVGVEISGTDVEDYVDNTSDIDPIADIGTHSNFTAQKYGPDLINDTLTEENTGGTSGGADYPIQNMNFTSDTSSWNFVIASGSDFAGGWDNTGQTGGSAYINVTTRNEAGEAYWNQSFVAMVNSTLQSVSLNHIWKVEVWNTVDSGTLKVILAHPNGTNWEVWTQTLSGVTSWSNLVYTNLTDYFTANGTYSLRLDVVADLGNADAAQLKIYYDDSGIGLAYSGEEANYELDLEVQWTSVDFDETNEFLCVYGGAMSAENITIDVWSGSGWENLPINLTSGWNNVSVTSYLTASNFTIRFIGSVETGDTTQNTWDIDAGLLHVWTEGGSQDFNYVLNMTENHGSNWKVRLKVYDNSSLAQLNNCSIYIYDGSNSTQIVILNGAYENQTGPWYDLAASGTEYIWMHVETSSSGTSYVYAYLEIRVPTTTTYARYIITFKIT